MKNYKKILTICGLASVLGVGCLTGAQLIKNEKPVEEIKEFTVDNTIGQQISVPTILRAATAENIDVSKTFVQTGIVTEDGESYNALRFITAVKFNEDIESISYIRDVDDLETKVEEVTKVYKSVTANGKTYYYDSTKETLTETKLENDYYFAVYVVAFDENSSYLAKDFTCHLCVDDAKSSPYMTASYNSFFEHYHVVDDVQSEELVGRTVVANPETTWHDGVTESYFSYVKKTRICDKCEYEETLDENATLLDPGTIDTDGVYTFGSIKKTSENKIANGIYLFGTKDCALNINGGNLITDGKTRSTSRIFLFKTDRATTLTMTGGAGKANNEVTFGLYDEEPNENADNFVVGQSSTTSSATNIEYTFEIPGAGTYYFGGTASLKVKSLQVEMHAIDKNVWKYDETGHWHDGGVGCAFKYDFEEHTYGDWTEVDDLYDIKECECGHKVKELKELHAGCEHNYVRTEGEETGEIKYVCEKCGTGKEEIKHFARYLPDKDNNVLAIADGFNNYKVSEGDEFSISYSASAAPAYKADTSHEFTMSDGTKKALTGSIGIDGKGQLIINAPGACILRLYCYTSSEINIKLAKGSGTAVAINSEKGEGIYHEIEYEIEEADTYNITSSQEKKKIQYLCVEVIY